MMNKVLTDEGNNTQGGVVAPDVVVVEEEEEEVVEGEVVVATETSVVRVVVVAAVDPTVMKVEDKVMEMEMQTIFPLKHDCPVVEEGTQTHLPSPNVRTEEDREAILIEEVLVTSLMGHLCNQKLQFQQLTVAVNLQSQLMSLHKLSLIDQVMIQCNLNYEPIPFSF